MTALRIFHTNDLHSEFSAYTHLAAALKQYRRPQDLYLDAGDFADVKSMLVTASHGVYAMQLLKEAGCDAMAVGNNEFFAGPAALSAMTRAGVPLLSCNVKTLDNSEIPGLLPYIILNRSGLRILILGVSPWWQGSHSTTAFTDMAGIRLENPIPILKKILTEEAGNYDLALLLSHAGMKRDRIIASALPELAVILGGHDHLCMETPECFHGVWIFQCGSKGESLGQMDLELDSHNNILYARGREIPCPREIDPSLSALLKREEEESRHLLSNPLYTLEKALPLDPLRESPAANAVADALHEQYESDFGLIHNGVLSKTLGPVISKLSLLEAAPSPLNPTTVFWKGSQIQQALEASFQADFVSQSGSGRGFRGSILGALSVSWNVRVEKKPFHMTIDGKDLDPGRIYRVAADDYLFRGTGYTMLKGSWKPEIYAPGYIRDLLEKWLGKKDFCARTFHHRIQDV